MEHVTQEKLWELFEYKDGDLIWKIKPSVRVKIGDKSGTLNYKGYIIIGINGKRYRAHRLIYIYFNGAIPSSFQIDHINQDKLDNRIENLRKSTHGQNKHNEKLRKNNTSGVKGISWHSKNEKWVAYCMVNGIQNRLGYFDSKKNAEAVVKKFREENHGEFCCHE